VFVFFKAEDGIRDAQESRGLGDVYRRQTPGDAAPVDNMVLHRNIAALFDVDEIDDLAFRLGIPPDEIEGKRRDTRARNLVLYADRRERVDDLVELVRQLRPEWRMQ